jgi:hypothetical protein
MPDVYGPNPGIEIDLGNEMWVLTVNIADLREQQVNAQVMQPSEFARLTENIKDRRSLESLPYCVQPKFTLTPEEGAPGPIEIVSGHHRVRAARAAGMTWVPILCDRKPISRSRIISKQLAHNALVGQADPSVIAMLVSQMTSVEDMLASGLREDALPTPEKHQVTLFTPHAEYRWKTVHFAFLPHQAENMDALVKQLKGGPDTVICVACQDQFEAFLKAVASYARGKKILSAGTAVAVLTEIALREVEKLNAAAGESTEQDGATADSDTSVEGAASGGASVAESAA